RPALYGERHRRDGGVRRVRRRSWNRRYKRRCLMRSIRPTRITGAAAVALAMLASQVGHAASTVRPARPNPTGMVAKVDAASRSLSPATGSVMLALAQSQGPNLGTWSIGEIDIPLNATGGAGGYTWSVIGSLPPGISSRTG